MCRFYWLHCVTVGFWFASTADMLLFFDYLLFALLFRSLFSFQLHRSLEVDCLALFVLMSDLCIGGRWQGLSPFASRPPQMAWYEMWMKFCLLFVLRDAGLCLGIGKSHDIG
jgi:hypothetical protein